MRAIADLYDKTRYTTPRLNPDFEVYGVEQRRLPRSYTAKQNALEGPSIHVVSSGMMFEGSLSNWIAQEIVEDENNAIFLVGFAKEDSPAETGRRVRCKAEGPRVRSTDARRARSFRSRPRKTERRKTPGVSPRCIRSDQRSPSRKGCFFYS